ncbi:MAG: hypothetical protein IJD85_03620 [Oscillospiraceae bacterium]|nr:hypothetical protein [Oscillospiraceae bacterium]
MADWIKTHKFSIIYFVSFLLYLFVPFEFGGFLKMTLAGVIVAVPIFLFQLIYIIWLRRKEKVSVGRSIARFFLYLLAVINVGFVCVFVNIFNNGYVYCGWRYEKTYYGYEAWEKAQMGRGFFGLFFIVFAVYLALYLAISAAIRRSQAKKLK